MKSKKSWSGILLLSLMIAGGVRAEDLPQAQISGNAEKLDLTLIKEKYKSLNETAGIRVVQNKAVPRKGRFEAGGFYGSMNNDPFLTIKEYGLLLGYNLTEFFGVEFLYAKASPAKSAALTYLESVPPNRGANTNLPSSVTALGLTFTPLYGKLSLMGEMILYYDSHLFLGGSRYNSETGTYTAPMLGIGETVFVSKTVAFRLDYRMMFFNENLPDKISGTNTTTPRSNSTGNLTFGMSVLF